MVLRSSVFNTLFGPHQREFALEKGLMLFRYIPVFVCVYVCMYVCVCVWCRCHVSLCKWFMCECMSEFINVCVKCFFYLSSICIR